MTIFCLCQHDIAIKKPLKDTLTKIMTIYHEFNKPFNLKCWTHCKNEQSIQIIKILIISICFHASNNVLFQ